MAYFNRYEPLTQLDYSDDNVSSTLNSDAQNDRVNIDKSEKVFTK